MKIACVQSNVAFNDPAANAATAIIHLERLAAEGVELAIFPEAFLTGYCVDSAEAAAEIALDLDWVAQTTNEEPPPAVAAIRDTCVRHKMHVVVGLACKNAGKVYNAAILFEPNGRMNRYFKTHLPELGLDKFVTPGDDLPVYDTAIGKIGIAICFDLRPPEPIRVLALKGAELIVLPTNWPEGAEFAPAHMAAVRACENRVYLAACNRVGTENGFRFIGQSGIWDVVGRPLAFAADGEEVLTADLDLTAAREKRIRTVPGKYETTIFESRRPELYGAISSRSESA